MLKTLTISSIALLGINATSIMDTWIPSMNQQDAWEEAYQTPLKSLDADDFIEFSSTLFQSADFDQNNYLDTDEYATFMVVKTEISRLNGFLAIDVDNKAYTLPLDQSTNVGAVTKFERTQIDALARTDFYTSAGNDQALSEAEFLANARDIFDQADRNLNGTLKGRELKAFSHYQASLLNNNEGQV